MSFIARDEQYLYCIKSEIEFYTTKAVLGILRRRIEFNY
jgi:hypothetical protein